MQILFYSRIWLLLNIKFASSYKFLCFLPPPPPTTFLSILDSDQPQGEMLLKSGSRLPKNDRLTQSTGELDVTSTYLAKGPQRDCSTLPSYHRPPSYEEASKQKDRIMMTEPRPSTSTGGRQKRRKSPPEDRFLYHHVLHSRTLYKYLYSTLFSKTTQFFCVAVSGFILPRCTLQCFVMLCCVLLCLLRSAVLRFFMLSCDVLHRAVVGCSYVSQPAITETPINFRTYHPNDLPIFLHRR